METRSMLPAALCSYKGTGFLLREVTAGRGGGHLQTPMTGDDGSGVGPGTVTGPVVSLPPN